MRTPQDAVDLLLDRAGDEPRFAVWLSVDIALVAAVADAGQGDLNAPERVMLCAAQIPRPVKRGKRQVPSPADPRYKTKSDLEVLRSEALNTCFMIKRPEGEKDFHVRRGGRPPWHGGASHLEGKGGQQ